eukprot:scaffold26963_cov155-Skeletonema_dohrnii-CCMP3373.AAC.3
MMNAILIGITTAVLTIPTITHAQPIDEILGVNFNYTPEQCTQWAIAAKASDTVQSASGGLSQSEFMNFLNSLVVTGSDTSITTFGNLPFEVQLGYPALACWCEELGDGEGCCEGGITARINVGALVEENPSEVAIAYKEDFCMFVALVVRELEKMGSAATTTTVVATSSSTVEKEDDDEGSTAAGTTTTVAPVSTTASATTTVDDATTITNTQASSTTILLDSITFTTVGSVINYSLEDPPQITAKDILDNSESRNGVIGQLSQGVAKLSYEVIDECPVSGVVEEKKSTRSFSMGVLGTLGETKVKDIRE